MKGLVTAAMVAGAAFLLWMGLHSTEPTKPVEPDPTPSVVTRGVFLELAERIDAGQLTSSDQLSLVAKNLYRSGDLTDSDLQRMSEALPDLTQSNRELTKADADKLRGL